MHAHGALHRRPSLHAVAFTNRCLTSTCKLGLPTPPQPQVHKHFTTALETVTAAGQLGTAIQTLSLCVRPLLVAGLPVQAANGSAAGAAGTAEDALEAAAAAAAVSVQPASEEQRAAAAQAIASGTRLRQWQCFCRLVAAAMCYGCQCLLQVTTTSSLPLAKSRACFRACC